MTTQPVSDHLPVYHEGYWADSAELVDEGDMEFFCGYVIEEVTAANAVRLGYRDGETGLKVRRSKVHLADVADLAEAKRAILADVDRRLCVLAEPHNGVPFYEAMLRAPA